MSLTTLLLIVVIVLLVGGGGWAYRDRGYVAFSPVVLILVILLVLYLTGHLGRIH